MAISIEMLREAGLSAEQILEILQKDRRKSWREQKRRQRAQNTKQAHNVQVDSPADKVSHAHNKRAYRIPADWSPGDSDIAFAQQRLGDRWHDELSKFHDYWVAAPGQKGTKLDWPATWRNWVRKAEEQREKGRSTYDKREERREAWERTLRRLEEVGGRPGCHDAEVLSPGPDRGW